MSTKVIDWQTARALYLTGSTPSQIAKIIGCAASTVMARSRSEGWETQRHAVSKLIDNTIVMDAISEAQKLQRRVNGLTNDMMGKMEDIAKQMGKGKKAKDLHLLSCYVGILERLNNVARKNLELDKPDAGIIANSTNVNITMMSRGDDTEGHALPTSANHLNLPKGAQTVLIESVPQAEDSSDPLGMHQDEVSDPLELHG